MGKGVVLLAQRVGAQLLAVGFIGRKAGDVVNAIGKPGGAFIWGVIADQVSAAARDHLAPVAGSVGRALLLRMQELHWCKRVEGTRVVDFSASGKAAFDAAFGGVG